MMRSGTPLGKCKPSQGSDREERLENCREQVSGWGARGPLGVTETLDCSGSNFKCQHSQNCTPKRVTVSYTQ